ncbi:hypothetical protein BJ878DRAFT_335916 [Calycina marina]|uniref:Hemerythrin-like domain-containing protein n=1 Tax=Calycina marina TaxID=1763456 RepID=A0A9P7Z5K3_9HELO|nr:hypothetical protein BJ878DRAFT_335916 [Calycina marina]
MGSSQTKPLTPGRKWADVPFQLLETPRKKARTAGDMKTAKEETGAFAAASEMVLIHNMIIRGLNSIYVQAPNIKEPKDVQDFFTYMYSWALLVHMHHHNEEEVIFPLLEKAIGVDGYMEKNVDQHKLFGPGLTAFDDYVKAGKAGEIQFDGVKVQTIIDSFASIFIEHLKEEIPTFLALDKYENKIDWPAYNAAVLEKAVKKGDTEFEIPFAIVNQDMTFEGGIHAGTFPDIPLIPMLLFKHWFIPKHLEAWRFAPCTRHGIPQDLPFA